MDRSNQNCPICPISKQTKLSFSLSTSREKFAFQLIHIDLWEPYAHKTREGCHYFLTVVDDHTRTVWTFMLPNKQFVFTQIRDFLASIET